tara:strand:- start:40122 stop:40874 length:753 start_codon:yes stop_codon:yes gene_type:complete
MSKFKKWVAFGDSHGAHVDKNAVTALEKFIKDYKPDHIIGLGDFFDVAALRSGLSSQESAAYDDLVSDMLWGYDTLERLRPSVYLLGNHEHRLWRVANDHVNGLIRNSAQQEINRMEKFCKERSVQLLPYHHNDGVYRLGNLSFVHGYTASMRAVAEHALHYSQGPGSGTIMGHLHRVEHASAKRHGGAQGWCAGCLCDTDNMSYITHKLGASQWSQGWLFGVVGKNEYCVWQAQKTGKQWLVPSGLKTL